MKELIAQINRTFENKTRLGIMSALMVNDSLDFVELRELLGTTDGNLSSSATVLEDLGYIDVNKRIVGKKSKTTYRVSAGGRKAFLSHLRALEALIRDVHGE